MAFYSGFFNSKGLDRTYTAEDFCDYLGSLICNGVQDTYGDCFSLTPGRGLTVRLGSGKAWISGHYFISNDNYSINLASYKDSNHPRYVSIGIVLDTSEAVRDVKIEVVAGTPAEDPVVPDIPAGGSKTRLHLYAVRVNPDASTLTEADITDYRDDESKCGYCKCILGKCKIADMLTQFAQVLADMDHYQETVDDLENRIAELQIAVEDIGDIVEIGQCGESVFYVLYSNGKLLLKGTGATYDYTSPLDSPVNESPFKRNLTINTIVVPSGITEIGNYLFTDCNNLETISLPNGLTRIGRNSLTATGDDYAIPQTAQGLTAVTIPDSVTEIGSFAFADTRIAALRIPSGVSTVGRYVFERCINLTTVRYEAPVVGEFMFVQCTHLTNVTLANTVTQIGSHWINYCTALTQITYEGTLDNWAAVTKGANWDGNGGQYTGTLRKVICLDGYMQYDEASNEWTEVRE